MKHAGSNETVTCKYDFTLAPTMSVTTPMAGLLAAPRNNVGIVGVTPGAAVYV
jgi:hypothetical protein